MEPRSVDPSEGLSWYGCGWKLFLKNPGMWVVLILILGVIAIVLNFIPFIGALTWALISPVLVGGLFFAASELDSGRKIEVGTLFAGFQDASKRTPLLILGAISLAFGIAIFVVMGVMMGGAVMMGIAGGPEAQGAAMGAGAILGMLLVAAMLIVLAMAMFFSIPLIMLKGTEPIEAIKISFSASIKNILAWLIFGVIYILLSIVAIIPFGLGFLVLIPVTLAAVYCSYKAILA